MMKQPEQEQGGRARLTLYVDYTLLQSSTGACAAAYSVLRAARHSLDLVYLPRGACAGPPRERGEQVQPPFLVTADGDVVASLSEILDWTRSRAASEQAA